MFNIFSPITYNTNLTPFLTQYYFGNFSANYNPFASIFNSYNSFMNNPFGISYGMPNYFSQSLNYPSYNIFCGNYGNPFGYYNNVFNPQQVQIQMTPQVITATPAANISSTPATQTPAATKPTTPVTKPQTTTTTVQKPRIGTEILKTAYKYSNCTEADGSHRKFCINDTCKTDDPADEEWCTDFVTYVVKETYQNQGKTAPLGFGNHDVRTLKNWAIRTGRFMNTANMAKKGEFIADFVKPGDIIILNENNASHTGFVTKVDKDGTIHTIEGNRDDKVTQYAYSPNYPDLSGFIRLT